MAAGARSRTRAIQACTDASRFSRRHALAKSYFDPYIDFEGCIKAFVVVDLNKELAGYDWRLSKKNVWKVERMLLDYPHNKLPVDWARAKSCA